MTWPPRKPDSTVSVVADIGPNHAGAYWRAEALIEAAAASGADAAKLQFYEVDDMVPINSTHEAYRIPDASSSPWAGQPLRSVYEAGRTSIEWYPGLRDLGRSLGIEVFGSVFSPHAVVELDQMDCPAFKLASPEAIDPLIISAIIRTHRPVVVSDGAADRAELGRALTRLTADARSVTLLHCVSAYPADPADYCLRTGMRSYHPVHVGLSDHTRGSAVACAAVAFGARMIEKHLMLEPTEYDEPPLDAAHSLTPHEFADYVADVRDAAAAVNGLPRPVGLPWSRRLAYTRNLVRGTVIDRSHLRTVRGREGVSADRFWQVLGQRLLRDVRAGHPVYEDHVALPGRDGIRQ